MARVAPDAGTARQAPGARLPKRRRLLGRSVRLRLTLLYGALFLASGVGLLAVTYLLVRGLSSRSVSVIGRGVAFRGPARLDLSALAGAEKLFIAASRTGVNVAMRALPFKVALNTPLKVQPSAHLVTSLPALSPKQAGQIRALQVTQHLADLHGLLVFSGLALLVMAVISIGLGWLVAGRVLDPLRTITAAARRVSATSLHERLSFAGPNDELKELADTFDGLLGRLESSFEAQRRFVANASHELRTPLARQRTLAEVALGDPRPTVESLQATVERLLVAGEQQERLIESLLTLARSERGLEASERFDLADVAESATSGRMLEVRRRGLCLEQSLASAAVLGAPVLFERLVANLVDNAIKYNVEGGRIEVATENRSGHCRLRVANTGPQIPAEDVERLLQPFQRMGAERVGHHDGSGLGLSIVQAIAAAHGAELSVRPRRGGGLEIEVSLPADGTGERCPSEPRPLDAPRSRQHPGSKGDPKASAIGD